MPAIKTGGVPTLASYGDAERLFNNTFPWRDKGREDERPLDKYNRRKRHFALVRNEWVEAYDCRLYGTTLVRYWKDGRITLTSHSSMASNAFANALIPYGIQVRYSSKFAAVQIINGDLPSNHSNYELYTTNRPEYDRLQREWLDAYHAWVKTHRLYQFKGAQLDIKREEGKWVICDPTSQTQPWVDRKIDMKKYSAVLKELGYPEFRAWWKAASQMGGLDGKITFGENLIADLRAGPERWTENGWFRLPQIVERMQDAIKTRYGSQITIVVKEHEYLHSWNEMDRFRKQAEKFG